MLPTLAKTKEPTPQPEIQASKPNIDNIPTLDQRYIVENDGALHRVFALAVLSDMLLAHRQNWQGRVAESA